MNGLMTEANAGRNGVIPMRRAFAFASRNTFDIPPIRALVKSYLANSKVSADPFARNKRWATYTNDINPLTAAECHQPAKEFLAALRLSAITPDLVLFDPPYSRRQVMECYQGFGREFHNEDSQYFTLNWRDERQAVDDILAPGGFVISCGWHTNGMQQSGRYAIQEILLVAHGGAHHDTICVVERKLQSAQMTLVLEEQIYANYNDANPI